jgi:hypothetical protein
VQRSRGEGTTRSLEKKTKGQTDTQTYRHHIIAQVACKWIFGDGQKRRKKPEKDERGQRKTVRQHRVQYVSELPTGGAFPG